MLAQARYPFVIMDAVDGRTEGMPIPTPEDLGKLRSGDHVKVGVRFDREVRLSDVHPGGGRSWDDGHRQTGRDGSAAESLWIRLLSISDGSGEKVLKGVVDSEVVNGSHHGICRRDTLSFSFRHVLDCYMRPRR